ncbi:hypothetical protein H0H93_012492 [Arthromyces matolae]|nr:hypothetical protein H0H93_012492 [Arthromyces matolae]
MFSQFRQAVDNFAPPRSSLDGQQAETLRDNDLARSNSLDSPTSSQLAESALTNIRKSFAAQRSTSTGSLPKQPSSASPREGRKKSRLEDRLRAATSAINEPSHSPKRSSSITTIVSDHPLTQEPPALSGSPVTISDNNDSTNVVKEQADPPTPKQEATMESLPSLSLPLSISKETELDNVSTKKTAAHPTIILSDPPHTAMTEESSPLPPHQEEGSIGNGVSGTSPNSIVEAIDTTFSAKDDITEVSSIRDEAPTHHANSTAGVPDGNVEAMSVEAPFSTFSADSRGIFEDEELDSKDPTSVEELQEKLKQLEQRFSGMSVISIPREIVDPSTDVSASYIRLKEEKQAADLVLQELTTLETVHNHSALRDYLQSLNLKTETFQEEIKRLNSKLEVHDDRFEELREAHRLESSSQLHDTEKLRKELSEAEALLKAAQSTGAQAEEAAIQQTLHIDNLKKDLESTKLLAKEEEEKRTKAISLLKTVRQKLVKAEKDKEDATALVIRLQQKETDESEKGLAEIAKLRTELDSANSDKEKSLANIRAQFDTDVASLRERYEKDIALAKEQSAAEMNLVQNTHAQEISEKESMIRSLRQNLTIISTEKNAFFDDLQLRQAELESAQSHLESLESRNTEYQYQLREVNDRYTLLKEDFAEAQRELEMRSREPTTSSDEIARLLSAAESKYDSKVFDLKKKLEAVEKERSDSDIGWSRKFREKAKEVDELRRITGLAAQTKEDHEKIVTGLEANMATLKEENRLLSEQLQELRQINSAARESDKIWKSQEQELQSKITNLESLIEESQQRESQMRTANKAVREELRKVQVSAALLERQRNPGVGYWASRSAENGSNSSQHALSPLPSETPSPASALGSSSPKTEGEEEVNLEYLRNVILQFLEHKEMRPNLVKVLSVILHFTPQETRRLVAKV